MFSLGILLYELSTLRRAFRAESDYETLQKIIGGDIAPPSSLVKDFPPVLEQLIQRAMALDPDARFQTAAAFGEAVEQVAAELGGIAGQRELRAFMAERFPDGVVEAGPIVETVERAIPRTRTSSQPPSGAVPSFFPSLVPAPPREQRITGDQAVLPPQPTPLPGQGPAPVQKTMLGHLAPAGIPSPMPQPSPLATAPPQMPAPAAPVSLPPAPEPDRGLPWALPVALVAIAVVTLAVIAAILLS